MAMEDDLKIEIHKLINSIDSKEKFNEVKSELEDRFGKLNEDVEIYMYEKWFESLCSKLKIDIIHETKNFIEIVVPEEVIKKLDMGDVFSETIKISDRFKFKTRGNNLVIILNTIRLDESPVQLLIKLLSMLYKYYSK